MSKIKLVGFEEIPSTNSYALNHMTELEDKTVLFAHAQTAGHGRFNRTWISENKQNLYLTIVLKPDEAESLPLANLTQYLSVVLCRILDSYGVKSQIKWPNDVLVDGKKILGILAEVARKDGKIEGIAIGVGINLNSTEEDIAKIDQKATSLNIETGSTVDKEEFFKQLIDEFFRNYEEFLKTGFGVIQKEYEEKSFFIGTKITIKEPTLTFSATAKKILDDGALQVETEKGEIVKVLTGDILIDKKGENDGK